MSAQSIYAPPLRANRLADMLNRLTIMSRERLSKPRNRLTLYAICAFGLFSMALLMGIVKSRFSSKEPRFDFAASDGKYYYVYASSILIDGDLDFVNQFQKHWGYGDADFLWTSKGYVYNKYPIGVSLSLAPSILVAHGLSYAAHSIFPRESLAPDGYSVLYQVCNLAYVMGLCWATFAMIDWLIAKHFEVSGWMIAVAVLSTWLGTQYLYYTVRFPLMAHTFSTFWVTACITLSAAAARAILQRRQIGWHWPAMALCLSMAIITRPTNLLAVIFCLYPAVLVIRNGLVGQLLKWMPLAILLAIIPVGLQMLVWNQMFGKYIINSYSQDPNYLERFFWTDPVLFRSLFSLQAGLLVWCPIWTMGIAMCLWSLRRPMPARVLIALYGIAFLLLWYANSAWWCWPFSNYPGRGFVELIGLPAIGIALLLHHAAAFRNGQKIALGLVIVSMGCAGLLAVACDLGRTPRIADDMIEKGPALAR